MKKGLSLLVAFALVFSLFQSVAFAATTPSEAGQKLKSLGIVLGDQDGNLMEDAEWKRQDVAVLLSRLMGQEDEAKNTPKSHTYADVRGTYYDGYLSWARENGYMIGHSDTEFGFDDPITVKEFLTVILRALGYDPDFSSGEVEELAVELGLVEEGTDFSANAKRGDTYVIIVTALDTEVAGTGKKLGTVLGLPGYEVVDPAVTGVTALNLKQVKVTFNKPVDKASAETLSNYKVYNANGTTDLVANGSASLQSDNTSVIITLGTALNNGQSAAKITVEGVKDTEGRTIAKFEGTFSAVDNTVPTVVGVKVVGPRDLEVEFSEPMKNNFVNDDFSVDNGGYFVTSVAVSGSKVTLSVGMDMTEGEHTLKVTGKAGSDYADYKPVPTTLTFTLVKDTTAPVATVLSVSPSIVKIGFNKPVVGFQDPNVLIRHTYNNETYQVLGSSQYVTANASNTEFTVDFGAADKPIPLGANNIYIAYKDADNGPFIKDRWGNKFEATSLAVNVALNTTKPTVKEVKFENAQTLKVIFSKPVESTSAQNIDNYTVKDSSGNEVTVIGAALGGAENNEVTLSFEAEALKGGSYSIEIKGVKDRELIANVMDTVTINLSVDDTIKPYVLASSYTEDSSDNNYWRIYIPFSEQMNAATLTKKNIQKKYSGAADYEDLGSDDSITVSADARSVVLKVKKGGTNPNQVPDIRVGFVTDLAGNGLSSFVATSGGTEDSKDGSFALDPDTISVSEVQAINKRQIKVVFSGRLSSVTTTGFAVYEAGASTAYTTLTLSSHSINSDNKSEVVFTLGKDMTTEAKSTNVGNQALRLVIVGASGTKSYLGAGLQDNATGVGFTDKIAPELLSAVVNATGTQITLTFSEPLKADTFADSTLNGFSVAGGRAKLNNVVDLGASPAGDTATIVLEGENFIKGVTVVSYTDAAGITDVAGNKLASFSNKKTE